MGGKAGRQETVAPRFCVARSELHTLQLGSSSATMPLRTPRCNHVTWRNINRINYETADTRQFSVEKWLPSLVRRCCSANGQSRNTRCSQRERSLSSSSSSRGIDGHWRRHAVWASARVLVNRTRTMPWLQVERPSRQLQRLARTIRRRRLTPWRTILIAELRRVPGILSRNRTNPHSQPLQLMGMARRWRHLRLEWLQLHQLAR